MFYSEDWKDYKLIDCSGGERLEAWGDNVFIRPDPQAIWKTPKNNPLWRKPDGHYIRSSSGGGHWDFYKSIPDFTISYKDLNFNIRPTNFKHTGLFPEQAANWDWARDLIENAGRPISVLNLFGYTGGATVACAKSGASVCHVDASKGMVQWCKDNAYLCGLKDAPIRYIVDDCGKFAAREIRRGRKYDAIIMDPPSYGRGPGGEVWKLEEQLYDFVKLTTELLSDEPLFFLINSYTTGFSCGVIDYICKDLLCDKFGGKVQVGELMLPVEESGKLLPCGCSGRWEK